MAQDKSWMEGQRFQGTVKFWRGSFGWLSCDAVTEKMGPRDVFLHRNDLNSVPVVADAVEFGLILDAKGQPKATNAIIVNSQKPHGKSPGGAAAKQGLGDSQVKRAALMLFRGSDVLVIQEMKEQSLMWSDLGGKVEPGEGILACALRELDEEARGFLSEDSIALLKKGVEMQFGDGKQPPEIVALKTTGSKPQSVAVLAHSETAWKGTCLDDDAQLHEPADLQLVVLSQLPDSSWEPFGEIANELVGYAASQGHSKTLRCMLDAGAHASFGDMRDDEDRHRALTGACANGHVEIVRLLLEAGADPDTTGGIHDLPAIAYAVHHKHVEIAGLLVEAGADICNMDRSKTGRTLLTLACWLGRVEMDGFVEIQPSHTPLTAACAQGHSEIARLLLEAGVDINKPDTIFNRTALILASAEGHVETVRLLLQARADPYWTDHEGCTALSCAVANSHAEVVTLLSEALTDMVA
ncbi:Ankrd17 [Symbiodinium necroappetens]|uniref:Ankrd17 protein n=1 Tax=Symbiodinium necroappetens TaxID=1628268 RepID=A0A813CC68_9DINO|nr:Ankrd17 [Symbiodinium necroappetens]